MKLLLLLSALALLNGGHCLHCYLYMVDDHEVQPSTNQPPSTLCPEDYTHCATVAWTTKLSTGEHVSHQEGFCATSSVCSQLCSKILADSELKSLQCQQQCCSKNGCNKFLGLGKIPK
uniref:UPAR/Ly6 domain-containing protein n=1 Tax=Ciona savignyi TaxID=51511 RepID=H2YFF5_CIOSA